MASQRVLLAFAVVVAVAGVLAAPSALAAELLVGDSQGWGLNIDYDTWVDGNDFFVGDTLVFKYAKSEHSVVQATAACSQANSLGVWNSGDDRVALDTSGTWWFFCGVDDHCQQGMGFNVTVLPATVVSKAPAPSDDDKPPSSAALNRFKVDEAVARVAAMAGAVVAAVVFI